MNQWNSIPINHTKIRIVNSKFTSEFQNNIMRVIYKTRRMDYWTKLKDMKERISYTLCIPEGYTPITFIFIVGRLILSLHTP